MNSIASAAKTAFFAGVAFAVLEAVVAHSLPGPLDPVPTMTTVLLSVAATGILLAVGAVAFAMVSPRTAAGMSLAVWAAVWGPHQAENAGWYRVGWCPTLVIAGTAFVAPPLAVALGALGGASGALIRHRDGAAGLTPLGREAAPQGEHPDMLLVTIDGVRKDSLLLHGGRWKPTSPFSPMGGWTHFSEAVSSAPWSLPSLHSLMSSMPVREHGGGLPTALGHSRRLSDAVPFPYLLQGAGYETSALVSNSTLSPEHGFADGFDRWMHADAGVEPLMLLQVYGQLMEIATGQPREVDSTRDARIVSRAIEIMGRPADSPRFLWVHLSALSVVRDLMDGVEAAEAYQAGIDARRQQLTRLAVAGTGWVVAVAGTHGVSMGEAGRWGFGSGLTDEELRVPLAIRRPGTQGGVVDRQVSTADLGHTLLAAAGRARHFPGLNLLRKRAGPVEVGGVRNDGNAFAGRTDRGHYLERTAGAVGPGVRLSDRSEENLRRTGYLD
jgi:hypothetical protein